MLLKREDKVLEVNTIEEILENLKPEDEAFDVTISGDSRFPYLLVCINKDVASVSFVENDFGALYVAKGKDNECECLGCEMSDEDDWMPDINSIISLEEAEKIVREFVATSNRPSCAEWQIL